MLYAVNHWGSHPSKDNDDCYDGKDFDAYGEAIDFYNTDAGRDVEYIEFDGPGVYLIRRNPEFNPTKDDYSAERSEAAMQAGMAFGCQGYNDVMGY